MSALFARREGKDRYTLGNDLLRLDFDLRTSDTMYNYIWARNPRSGEFERVYNFGCDVGARERGTTRIVNTIGVKLQLRETLDENEVTIKLVYPSPLVVYRQFEKAASPAAIWNYPDLPQELPSNMRLCDATLAVTYTLRRNDPSFVTSAYHLGGVIDGVTPILNAMWVDNEHVPETMYVEDFGEFDWNRQPPLSHLVTCDVRYCLFYNRDGSGVPYGLVIHGRQKQSLFPHPGNPDGEGVFKVCSTNQEFQPKKAPVDRFNDTNVWCPFTDSRITSPLQWVLFPQFGWGQGGSGPALLQRLRQEMEEKHLSWWAGATRQPSAEIFVRPWPARQPPNTLWR
jgi:hypothetical protein